MTITLQVKRIATYSSLLLGGVAVALILYWLWSPPKEAITVHELPVPVQPTEVKPGEFITMKYSYCKNTDASGKVQVSLVSSTSQILLPESTDYQPAGCHENVDVPFPIPKHAQPDVYKFHFDLSDYCPNHLKCIPAQEWDSEEFEVRPKDDENQGIQGVQGQQGEKGIQGRPGESR